MTLHLDPACELQQKCFSRQKCVTLTFHRHGTALVQCGGILNEFRMRDRNGPLIRSFNCTTLRQLAIRQLAVSRHI